MKNCQKILAGLLCLMMVFSLAVPSFAADAKETGYELSIKFAEVPSVCFRLYRVGETSYDGDMTLTGAYAAYPVDMNVTTNEAFQIAADTLWGYIQADNLKPNYTAETDKNGVATFSNLQRGLYLIGGQTINAKKGTYVLSAQMWSLPYRANTADKYSDSIVVNPKYTFTEIPLEQRTVKVLKIWDDSGSKEKRPESVTVKLLNNGVAVDSVVLSAKNNWRHVWDDLEAGNWTVVEEPVKDYTVKVTRDGINHIVTNSYVPKSTTQSGGTIPQTGLMWQPVPVLLVLGLVLIMSGTLLRRKGQDEA